MNAIPGVQLAAITSALPAAGQAFSTPLVIEDRPAESSEDLTAEGIRVSPDYFRVIQAPLVRGRFFMKTASCRWPSLMKPRLSTGPLNFYAPVVNSSTCNLITSGALEKA